MFIRTQRILRKIIALSAIFFAVLFLSLAYFLFGFHVERTVNPRLAFWMEHDWSTGIQNDFSKLKSQTAELRASDLFFHVGPLKPDGSLASDLNIPETKLAALGTTNYAWIGQIRSNIDLDNSNIRSAIIRSANWLLERGFDGIHLDIEPVASADKAFLDLLKEMRAQTRSTAKISVATDEWQPDLISRLGSRVFNRDIKSYWTSTQFTEVAKYADQIVVMTYDSTLNDPALYSWWVEQQTLAVSNLVPDKVELFIGIPSYGDGAENIQTGLAGYIKGYRNIRADYARLSGIAIYSYWETDDAEFQTLKQL